MNRPLLLLIFGIRVMATAGGLAILAWFISGTLGRTSGPYAGVVDVAILILTLFGVVFLPMWCWSGRPWPHTTEHSMGSWTSTRMVPGAPGWFTQEQLEQTAATNVERAAESDRVALLLGDANLRRG